MAKTLNKNYKEYILPYNFSDNIFWKLNALNAFRQGGVNSGLIYLDISDKKRRKIPSDLRVTDYHVNHAKFFRDMENIVKVLKEHNL